MCTCSLFTMGSSQQQLSLICICRGIIIIRPDAEVKQMGQPVPYIGCAELDIYHTKFLVLC